MGPAYPAPRSTLIVHSLKQSGQAPKKQPEANADRAKTKLNVCCGIAEHKHCPRERRSRT